MRVGEIEKGRGGGYTRVSCIYFESIYLYRVNFSLYLSILSLPVHLSLMYVPVF